MATSTPRKRATDGAAARFFEELAGRGHEPLLQKVSGRVRFDVVDGGHVDSWSVAVDDGDLTVARDPGPADCTFRGDGALFEEIVAGRTNAVAAVLRGALVCHGDLQLLFSIQRIFPDPPRGWDPTADTRSG